jgi:hypothetical protein
LSSEDNGITGNCLRVTANGVLSNPSAIKIIAVKPGEIWQYTGAIKEGSEATGRGYIQDISNGYATIWTSGSLEAGSDWATSFDSGAITIPAGCVSLQIILGQICLAGATTYIDFDNVTFTKTSTDDLTLVVDKAADGASSVVSMYHDGVQVGTSQTITNTAGKDVILASKNHFLSGDFGSSLLKKRRFALGSELSSGTTSANKAYKITATQANYFFTGCAIGNIFMTNTAKTFDANNKAQEVILP